ncbi:MAG: acyl-CoA carboxylase subunit beta [Archaeoglobales archaeon]|nr:acyl-CoA carboxylase subunit beta [Archaeoglobales archaeon]
MRGPMRKLNELYERKKRLQDIMKTRKIGPRERINLLIDSGSFLELNAFVEKRSEEFGLKELELPYDGVITGIGTIDGRPVAIYSQDFSVLNGSIGEMHGIKIANLYDHALKVGIPVVGIVESSGARIQEGVDALKGLGEVVNRIARAKGVVPQINIICGPCTIGATFLMNADFVIMIKDPRCYSYIVDPQIIKIVTGEEISSLELGGWEAAAKSGNCHFVAENDFEAIQLAKKILSYLPLNNLEDPPKIDCKDPANRLNHEINKIVPEDQQKAYDIRDVVKSVVDDGEFIEVQEKFAQNVFTCFARLDGRSVGVVANNPAILAGCLDSKGCMKIANFVRFCDSFNIPVINFVDVPGYLPSAEEEQEGLTRHVFEVVLAYSRASIPILTVIVRKAYGGAYIAMGSKHVGADFVFAFPTSEISVVGPETAVEILYRDELEKTKIEKLSEKLAEYREKHTNPYRVAARGYIDDVIDPKYTRIKLISALRLLESKRSLR